MKSKMYDLYNAVEELLDEIKNVRDDLERIRLTTDRQFSNRLLVQCRAIDAILADYEQQTTQIMKEVRE